jgi:hypothetical protein
VLVYKVCHTRGHKLYEAIVATSLEAKPIIDLVRAVRTNVLKLCQPPARRTDVVKADFKL